MKRPVIKTPKKFLWLSILITAPILLFLLFPVLAPIVVETVVSFKEDFASRKLTEHDQDTIEGLKHFDDSIKTITIKEGHPGLQVEITLADPSESPFSENSPLILGIISFTADKKHWISETDPDHGKEIPRLSFLILESGKPIYSLDDDPYLDQWFASKPENDRQYLQRTKKNPQHPLPDTEGRRCCGFIRHNYF